MICGTGTIISSSTSVSSQVSILLKRLEHATGDEPPASLVRDDDSLQLLLAPSNPHPSAKESTPEWLCTSSPTLPAERARRRSTSRPTAGERESGGVGSTTCWFGSAVARLRITVPKPAQPAHPVRTGCAPKATDHTCWAARVALTQIDGGSRGRHWLMSTT